MTTSSILRFVRSCSHFLSIRFGRYFVSHRRQNWVARTWAILQPFLETKSASQTVSGATLALALANKKWFGVSASGSDAFTDRCVNGRPLRRASTSDITVVRISSDVMCPLRTRFSAGFANLISLSQAPSKCGADGGENTKRISRWVMNPWSSFAFQRALAWLISRSPETKLVSLSE